MDPRTGFAASIRPFWESRSPDSPAPLSYLSWSPALHAPGSHLLRPQPGSGKIDPSSEPYGIDCVRPSAPGSGLRSTWITDRKQPFRTRGDVISRGVSERIR